MSDFEIIDLTDWFGAGKEPTTVSGFKSLFTKSYYGCCPTPIKLTQKMIENEPTYGYNQILNRTTFTSNGITWTRNDDYSYSLSGTTTSTYSSFGLGGILKKNHKYLNHLEIIENPNNIAMGSGFFNMGTKNPKISYGTSAAISTYPYDSRYDSMGIDQYGGTGVNLTGIKIRFMIIDLTDWYGEGNEPTTVEEFKQTFPNIYYPYSVKRLLNRYMINNLRN